MTAESLHRRALTGLWCAVAAIASACGEEATVVGQPAEDAAAAADAAKTEVSTSVDAGAVDSAGATDAGAEAGADSSADAGTDAAADAGGDGGGDVPPDGGGDTGPACTKASDCPSGQCKGGVCAAACDPAQPCDDGDACTVGDQCKGPLCIGATKPCDDQNPCTADSCDKSSGCAHAAAPGACDDGSACTTGDACKDGACAGAPADCDDKNPCTDDTCDKAKGCGHAPNAGPCEDGNGCTLGDSCKDGGCQGGKPKPCDDGNPCTKDACDAVGGACAATAVDIGCDDGNLCTEGDACQAGACKGKAVVCEDKNPCTTDKCDPSTSCSYLDNSGLCDDGNACTDFDKCGGGKCKGAPKDAEECDDANPCTTDSCDKATGCAHVFNTATCDDGDPCTPGDACAGGKCAGGASICPCKSDADCAAKEDGNACNGTLFCDVAKPPYACKVKPGSVVACDTSADGACAVTSCDQVTGKCAKVNEKDGQACDADANVCTANDACLGGACKAGAPVPCDDANACTNDSCDPKSGCAYAANASPCDADGTACTVGDQCADKICVAGKLKTCNDNEACTKDACDPKTGACAFDPKALDGQPCDADGSGCTPDDACQAGACQAGKPLNCDDKNGCTIDKCDPKSGCLHLANAEPCDADANACTIGDKCDAKICTAGPKKNCDDGDACTSDACDPKTAQCSNMAIVGCGGNCAKDGDCDDGNPCSDDACAAAKCSHKTNSAACDDGSKCTTSDACVAGKCTGVAVKCNDGNVCTDDACDLAVGCTVTANNAACDDGDLCTAGDACAAGSCVKGKPKGCDDGDPCTADTCNPGDGTCKFNGIPGCGIFCAKAGDCDDKNPCTDESCQGGKCSSVANTLACSDGDGCTGPDLCGSGKCNPGQVKNCNDNNVCTDDSCDKASGACVNLSVPATTLCNDSNACTANDACGGINVLGKATCTGSIKSCDDANACTADSCNAANAGCVNTPLQTGACEDGDACSLGDACNNGACTAGNKVWVDTLAGGLSGYLDAKGAAARFNVPSGVAFDSAGTAYVADAANHRIRKLAPDGTATTLAGSGNPGLNDQKGASAQFSTPLGVAVDPKGEVWVADTLNHAIRKISAGGDVATLAGTGLQGFKDGAGGGAQFNRPYALAVGPGGVAVVADTFNHRIRRVTPSGVATTLAGSGVPGIADGTGVNAQFNYPIGVAVDAHGDAFVVDNSSHRIRKVGKDGKVTTIAGLTVSGQAIAGYKDGNALAAQFNGPWGIAIMPDGGLLISDRNNQRVRRLFGGVVSTWAGDGNAAWQDGVAAQARFNAPNGIAIDGAGVALVADSNNHRVRRIRDATSWCAIGGKCWAAEAKNPQNACQTCQPATAKDAFSPLADAATCTDGDLCTAGDACQSGSCQAGKAVGCDDNDACTTDSCNAVTGACVSVAIVGCGGNCAVLADCDDKNTCTTDACVAGKCQNNNNTLACEDGNPCTFADKCANGVCVPGSVVWTSTVAGGVQGNKDGKGAAAQFNRPAGIAVDAAGNLWVSDWSNHNVRKVAPDGTVTTVAGSGVQGFADGVGANAFFSNPVGVEAAPNGFIYIADWSNSRVRTIDPATGEVKTLAGGPAGYAEGPVAAARFNGLAATATTVGGAVYVSDPGNHRIRKIQGGMVTTVAGGAAGYADGVGAKAQFNNPRGIALDDAGNLYIVDQGNQRIRKMTPAGAVSTIAGSGTTGYFDGAALQAAFNNPWGIAWDKSGTLTIIDRGNLRVRRLSPSGGVSTLAGNGAYGANDGIAAVATFASTVGVAVDARGTAWVADFDSARVRKVVDAIKPCAIGGQCQAAGTVNPANECQACDASKNATGWTARPDGAACSDGQYCTSTDACSGGTCAGKVNDCDDKDTCTTDACDKVTGACTSTKIIGCSGYCTANNQCDDQSVCTTDACTNNLCAFTYNTAPCDDGNPCTAGDACKSGKCQAGVDVATLTIAGSGVGGFQDATGTAAQFNYPYGVEVSADGSVLVADAGNHRIRRIAPDGTVTTLAGSGQPGWANGKGAAAQFSSPTDLARAATDVVFVVDRDNHAVRKLTLDGTVSSVAGGGVAGWIDDVGAKARFYYPYSAAVTAGGVVYVADTGNNRVRKIGPTGVVTTLAGSAAGYKDDVGAKALFNGPIGIGIDAVGNLIVADYNNHRIRKVTPEGVVSTLAGSGIAGLFDDVASEARFQYPWGIAFDTSGAIIVADRYNHRLRRIAGGAVTTWAGSVAGWQDGAGQGARFYYPANLAFDNRGGVWVTDGNNHRVRRVRATALSCAIGGVCYSDGATGPGAPCQRCDGATAPTKWTAVADSAPCVDGDLCTIGDTCASGSCAGAKNACDDKNACTADACDALTGACSHTPIANCP